MSNLKEMTKKFPQTEFWNDSCSVSELKYAIENGAVGATTNPVIVHQVLKKNLSEWENRIKQLIELNPTLTEDEIAWLVIGELGIKASQLLMPIYNKFNGQKGKLSFQVNAKYDCNYEKIVEHALLLSKLVTNSQIKAPTSSAGIKAFEELTYLGVSINATVSYTLSQAIAVANAVEKGINRRIKEGKDISNLSPVCTLMVGRLDDYLKEYVRKNNLLISNEALEFAGVAVAKKAYQIFKEKNYTTKILIAAFRNQYHWSELIGGDLIFTIPYKWQQKFNELSIDIQNNILKPVNNQIMNELLTIDEFKKAYEYDGLLEKDFSHYGAYKATINQFLSGYDEFVHLIRSYKLNID